VRINHHIIFCSYATWCGCIIVALIFSVTFLTAHLPKDVFSENFLRMFFKKKINE